MSTREKALHDYRTKRWGWSYSPINGGKDWFSAVGHGHDINVGDEIIISLKGVDIRYDVNAIEYFDSPSDMWKGSFRRVDAVDNPQEPE